MQQGFQLRDVFNPAVVDQLAHAIKRTWPAFDQIGFSTTVNSQLGPEIPHCEITGFDGFIVMPQNDFVAKYGTIYAQQAFELT